MSLCLTLITANGIVLAGDSRLTYSDPNNENNNKIGSDHTYKVFKLNDFCGLTSVGSSSFEYEGKIRSIKWIIDDFKAKNDIKDKPIKEVVNQINSFFSKIVNSELEHRKKSIKQNLENNGCTDVQFEKIPNLKIFKTYYNNSEGIRQKGEMIGVQLQFQISGYNNKSSEFYRLNFILDKYQLDHQIDSYNLYWSGQDEYVSRIILGYDTSQFDNLSFFKNLNQSQKDNIKYQLSGMACKIEFHLMPLQDAIELAKLLIETTSAIQKFSDGTFGGRVIHGVGGAVDVAVITPFEGFHWIAKKKLNLYGKEIELEKPSTQKKN